MTSFNMNRAFQSKNKRVSIKSCFLFVVVSHRWPAELLSAAVVQQFFLSCIPLPQRHNQHCSGLSSGQRQLCFGALCSELCQFSLWLSVGECMYGRGGGEKQAVGMILFLCYLWQNLTFSLSQHMPKCKWNALGCVAPRPGGKNKDEK